jgi:hypothetical protein
MDITAVAAKSTRGHPLTGPWVVMRVCSGVTTGVRSVVGKGRLREPSRRLSCLCCIVSGCFLGVYVCMLVFVNPGRHCRQRTWIVDEGSCLLDD